MDGWEKTTKPNGQEQPELQTRRGTSKLCLRSASRHGEVHQSVVLELWLPSRSKTLQPDPVHFELFPRLSAGVCSRAKQHGRSRVANMFLPNSTQYGVYQITWNDSAILRRYILIRIKPLITWKTHGWRLFREQKAKRLFESYCKFRKTVFIRKGEPGIVFMFSKLGHQPNKFTSTLLLFAVSIIAEYGIPEQELGSRWSEGPMSLEHPRRLQSECHVRVSVFGNIHIAQHFREPS